MKNLIKTAIIGYCGYKVLDALFENPKVKEVKEEEEYVSFDEIEVKDDPKQDVVKNAAMFVGGLALGMAIKPTKKIIQEHHHITIFKQ